MRTNHTCLLIITLGTSLFAAASSGAATPDEQRARREADRVRPVAVSPVEVVDGTPRPLPSTTDETTTTHERYRYPGPDRRVSNSLLTTVDEPSMADNFGGDDIVIASSPDFDGWSSLARSSDGDYFAAVEALGDVSIYRSSDAGESWTLWTTLSDPAGTIDGVSERILIGENPGVAERVFVAFHRDDVVKVAYADINAGVPVWTLVTVISDPAISFHLSRVDFDIDYPDFEDYYVYVVADGTESGTRHVYFARSTNQGNSYETPYKIAESVSVNEQYSSVKIAYGQGGYIHVAFHTFDEFLTSAGAKYRRASAYAGGGIGAWAAMQTIEAMGVSNPFPTDLTASLDNGGVHILMWTPDRKLRYSSDNGATWPGSVTMPDGGSALSVIDGGVLAYSYMRNEVEGPDRFMTAYFTIAPSSAPSVWNPSDRSSKSPTASLSVCPGCFRDIIPDPDFGNRFATLWVKRDDPNSQLRFDAEWRRDPGYPNTDIGFPVAIPGGLQTPPAIVQLDDDPELEIVFATNDGNVHVVTSDGQKESGWPVDIGGIGFDAPVAIGDLTGNGTPTIVAGASDGKMWAFDPDGSLKWSVGMNYQQQVYVSIGALGPPNARYVVATCGDELRATRYDGVAVSTLWGPVGGTIHFGAAIGDIDNDGVAEAVIVAGDRVLAYRLDSAVPVLSRQFPGETLFQAPALADVDFDGDLEIAVATVSEEVFLIHHDGSDFPGWPITIPGGAIPGVAFAQIVGTTAPEIIFAESDGPIHVRYTTGVEQTGFPIPLAEPIFMPPTVFNVNISGSNVNIGTTVSETVESYRNLPAIASVPGFPKNAGGRIEESLAAGDIDNDGRQEIVVLTLDYMTVLDVGIAPNTNPTQIWPMYQYDPQRTGCLACDEVLTGVSDTPSAKSADALQAHPNPFNPTTIIEYSVAAAGKVWLEIFDVRGAKVATLIEGEFRDAGDYRERYTAATASGAYFARLRTVAGETTRKIVLLK